MELQQQRLVPVHVREVPPAVGGVVLEDSRGGLVGVGHWGEHRLALGNLVHDVEHIGHALVVADAAVVTDGQGAVLRRIREGPPEAGIDEPLVAGPIRTHPLVDRPRLAVGAAGLGVDVSLARRGLDAALVGVGAAGALEPGHVARVAEHPAAGGHEGRAGQGLDGFGHLGRIEPVDLFLVVEVRHGAGPVGQHEAVGVEGEVLPDGAAIADPHLEGAVAAGVDLHARRDEAAVDVRSGQQVVDLGLDGADPVLDVGFQNAH